MSEKSTKLKVEGIPQDVTVSQLSMLLSNKRRQGGGPIESIELIKGTAIATFETSDGELCVYLDFWKIRQMFLCLFSIA